jgi:phosphoribosylanthranilate isomerase
MSVEVKICGVCVPADAALAAEAGADHIGVILAPGRTRSRTVAEAASIFDAAAGAKRVGVFVDAPAADIRSAVARLRLDVVQLHGSEAPAFTSSLRDVCAVWKAVRVRAADVVEAAMAAYDGAADALLLDSWSAHAEGGTGTAFDWRDVAPLRAHWPASLRLVAAGGLRPDNVGSLIEIIAPHIVDVSSGVESAPGLKAAGAVRAFVAEARAAGNGK